MPHDPQRDEDLTYHDAALREEWQRQSGRRSPVEPIGDIRQAERLACTHPLTRQ